MLLYSLLYLSGYDLPLDEINFKNGAAKRRVTLSAV